MKGATSRIGRKTKSTTNVDEKQSDGDFMMSLAKGLAVMQVFSKHQHPLTASQISLHTGISRAAVRRCLHTLMTLGFSNTVDQQHFSLSPKVLSLGHAYLSSTPLVKVARPVLERLSESLSESCSVAIMEEFDVLYIATAAISRIMSIDMRVGSRLPAYCTATGRVFLANMKREQLDAYFSRTTLTRYTNRTVISEAKLREVLEGVKRSGYAIVDQELEVGLRSLAVPITDSYGSVVGDLNVLCYAQRNNIRDMQNTFLPHLRKAALEIAAML
jgi:IclR family pca regulon transcriptional regulator